MQNDFLQLLLALEESTLLSVYKFSVMLSSTLVSILAGVMVMLSCSASRPMQDRASLQVFVG